MAIFRFSTMLLAATSVLFLVPNPVVTSSNTCAQWCQKSCDRLQRLYKIGNCGALVRPQLCAKFQRDMVYNKCHPDCEEPPMVLHATADNSSRHVGSALTYICEAGSTLMSGPAEVVCQDNSTWTRPNFTCAPDCAAPPTVPRASITGSAHQVGTTMTYTCEPGTSVAGGPATVVCQANSTWTTPTFTCQDVCSPNLCKNGGICTPTGETFQCDCIGGFFGMYCDFEPVTGLSTRFDPTTQDYYYSYYE